MLDYRIRQRQEVRQGFDYVAWCQVKKSKLYTKISIEEVEGVKQEFDSTGFDFKKTTLVSVMGIESSRDENQGGWLGKDCVVHGREE